jgi:hypothetical protein
MSQVTSMSRENSHLKGIQDRPEDRALICLLFARKAGRLSSPSSGRSGHGFLNSGDFLHPRPCFSLASASSNSRHRALTTRYRNSIMIAGHRWALLDRAYEQAIQGKSKLRRMKLAGKATKQLQRLSPISFFSQLETRTPCGMSDLPRFLFRQTPTLVFDTS